MKRSWLAQALWWVVISGCSGDDSLASPCGPRDELIGVWRRGDTALVIDLDATFTLRDSQRWRAGRYQVSDTLLRLLYDDGEAVDSRYCVTGARLQVGALGSPFEQVD